MTRKKIDEDEKMVRENLLKNEEPPKKRNILSYFLFMIIIFTLIEFAIDFTVSDLSYLVLNEKYGIKILSEIFLAILTMIVMLLFKNSYVFTRKTEKLGKSLLFAAPMVVFSVFMFGVNVMKLNEANLENVIGVFLLCALVGITEEFLCRGWVLNEFLERFGDNKKNIITSIALSSIIFGVMHITNVLSTSQNLFETILQIINAAAIGFLLGSLYYKTKNIWSVIILHAFYDFALMIGEINIIKDCTYGNPTSKVFLVSSFATIMLSVFWVISAIIILKKSNYPDKGASGTKSFYIIAIPVLLFTFLAGVIPYEKMISDYDDYYVCYTYKEYKMEGDYTLHTPVHSKYSIKYENNDKSYILKDNNDIEEVTTISDFNFSLYNEPSGLILENMNTGKKTNLSNGHVTSYFVVENEEDYTIVYISYNSLLEEEVYISNIMTKKELSNSNEYLGLVKASFKKIELPELGGAGYVTFDNAKTDTKYPAFESTEHDRFIYKDGEILIVK